MKKDCCRVCVTEIENGYRIEITGDSMKDKFAGCCNAEDGVVKKNSSGCCAEEIEKK